MFCKQCGGEIKKDAVYCPKCGINLKTVVITNNEVDVPSTEKKIVQVSDDGNHDKVTNVINTVESKESESEVVKNTVFKFCKYCGKEIPDGSVFCPKCGLKVAKSIKTEMSDFFKSSVTEDKSSKDYEETHTVTVNIANERKQNIDTFKFKYLFTQVFKHHTTKEREELLKVDLNNASNIRISPHAFQPWFYSRVFLILFTVFMIFEFCLFQFNNTNLLPGIMLIGSLMIPFSLLTLFFELNVYKDISFIKVIGFFLLGGALSLLFTLFLYEVIPVESEFNFFNALLIGIIEEIGKALIIIIVLKKTENTTILQGLLIGSAIGCGFAAFESSGYAFNAYLNAHDYNTRVAVANEMLPWYYQRYAYTDSWVQMNLNIIVRAALAFGGHTAWGAIAGAAYSKNMKITGGFTVFFLLCIVLHAIWDTQLSDSEFIDYIKLIFLCIIVWILIIHLLKDFITEKRNANY